MPRNSSLSRAKLSASSINRHGLTASITRNIAALVMLAVGNGRGTKRPTARKSVLLPQRIVGDVITSLGE